jgi:hypothetical protein
MLRYRKAKGSTWLREKQSYITVTRMTGKQMNSDKRNLNIGILPFYAGLGIQDTNLD